MKFLILSFLVFAAACQVSKNNFEPVQVNRSLLTLDRFETHYRYPGRMTFIIWKDKRGIEYQEEMRDNADTSYLKKGITFAQLLKK